MICKMYLDMSSNTMGGTQTSDTAQEMVQFSGGTFTPSIANMVVCRHLQTRFLKIPDITPAPPSACWCRPFGKVSSCDITIEMRKTDSFEETRLVLHVPSSS